jgi:hypothetical protein
VDPGISAALRSVGFIDVLSSVPAESSCRARKKLRMRLADLTVCAASLRTFRNNPGVMDYLRNEKGESKLSHSKGCFASGIFKIILGRSFATGTNEINQRPAMLSCIRCMYSSISP